jgi:hypothetical protein
VDAAGIRKPKRKGGMSEEGRRRIAEAQRARWAKLRAEASKAGAKVRDDVRTAARKSKRTK